MTEKLTRKQRELLMRREYILEVAQSIIIEDGYIGFTMDKIAEATEYAKGTIYQMFANKEEIIMALAIMHGQRCYQLFERAAEYDGNSREKITAISLAQQLATLMHPKDFSLMLLIKNDSIKDKVKESMQQDMFNMESKIITLISGIVQAAIDAGDITVDISAENLVFCLWSMCFGGSALICSDIELDKHGISKSYMLISEGNNRLLDGFGWKPLHTTENYQVTMTKLATNIFPAECKQTGFTTLFSSL